jgi:hypothetical protein
MQFADLSVTSYGYTNSESNLFQYLKEHIRRKKMLRFDPDHLPHPSVQLSTDLSTATSTYDLYLNNETMFIFTDLTLHDLHERKLHFNIKSCATFVAVGAGDRDFVLAKRGSYTERFQHSSLGHGLYLVSSNGYVGSSTDSAFNNHNGEISFKSGDIITLSYNVLTKTIQFFKNGNVAIETMDGVPSSYYPCVALYSNTDSVTIMDDIHIEIKNLSKNTNLQQEIADLGL